MPKISIIIPVYNSEKYLRECLTSIEDQTLKDIEIICVDDGSNDNSINILKEYADKDSRVKLLKQNHLGSGCARNNGIKNATGEFIIFMDSDDLYPENNILENLYNAAKENNVKICGGEFSYFSADNPELIQDFALTEDGYKFDKTGIIDYQNYQFDYGFHRFIYSRQFLLENNIFFPPYKRFQDPPFFVNAMILAKQFYALQQITYAYRTDNRVKWDSEKTNDMLCGILDNFKYAYHNQCDKLAEYTFERFKAHYNNVVNTFNFRSIYLIYKMTKYSAHKKYFMKKILEFIFYLGNSRDKSHKVIKILGLRISIRRG